MSCHTGITATFFILLFLANLVGELQFADGTAGCAAATTGSAKNTPQHQDLTQTLENTLAELVAAEKYPGATLAVLLADGQRISLASGFEDLQANKPMQPGAIMFAGSCGKTFVSAVALQLVAEGKLRLDDRAGRYFDDAATRSWYRQLPNAKTMTVRSLMNHTSGLPRYIFQESFLEDVKANPMKPRSPKECLAVLHGLDAIHPVGDGWGYSDSNYLLLGLILEKVDGKSYYEMAQQRLLGPLQLSNTRPSTQAELPGLIQGHISQFNPFELPKTTVSNGRYAMNPSFEWCGGGYITSVDDLAKWLQALHSGQVLDEQVYRQLLQPVDFRTGQAGRQGYGLGSFVWQTELGEFVGHAGIMPGYLTQIEYSREHKFAIAIQANTDQGMGQNLHRHVQSIARQIVDHGKQK